MLGRNLRNCSKDNIDNNVTTEIIINVTNEPSEYMFNGRLSDRQCTSRRSVDREQFPFYRFCYTPRCGDTPVLFLLLLLFNTNVTLYASSWYYSYWWSWRRCYWRWYYGMRSLEFFPLSHVNNIHAAEWKIRECAIFPVVLWPRTAVEWHGQFLARYVAVYVCRSLPPPPILWVLEWYDIIWYNDEESFPRLTTTTTNQRQYQQPPYKNSNTNNSI